MPTRVKPIPDDYRGATPYLCVSGAAKAIDFYTRAFGAREQMRMQQPDGRIGHAELRIGDAATVTFHLHDPGVECRRSLFLVRSADGWRILHLHASNTPLTSG